MAFQDYINTLIIAVLFGFLGLIIGKLAEKISFIIIRELEVSSLLEKTTEVRISFEKHIPIMIKWIIAIFGIYKGLAYLHIEMIFITLLLILIFLMIFISLAFSISNWVPNLISGILLRKKISCLRGKLLYFDTISGKIECHTLTHTFIISNDGDRYAIPNNVLRKKCMMFV